MGVTNANLELSHPQIPCGDSFQVTLSLTGEPDIVNNPTDIVLILDRSRSMAGSPLANLKAGAKKFLDILYEATGSNPDGQIGHGSRIAIVSFASTATQDTGLVTSVQELKAAVDGLTANGSTNHADAFAKATALLDGASTNEKILVMFTDGITTAGGDAAPDAAAAKAQGAVIYSIGLSGNGGIDQQALEAWASEPSSSYVAVTPNDTELEKLFGDLAANIAKPGATHIVLRTRVTPCFRVTALTAPLKGAAKLQDANTVQWELDTLGEKRSEGAVLTFTVQHLGPCSGEVKVIDAVEYQDEQGNTVIFPEPAIFVDCGVVVNRPCPRPREVTFQGCQDSVVFNAQDIHLDGLGRIVEVDLTLKNICPHRRVALAVILTEKDSRNVEHMRGVQTLTIPAHTRTGCRDVTVRCIKFVLPEDLDVTGTPDGICDRRNLQVRVLAHYVDSDFDCCDSGFQP